MRSASTRATRGDASVTTPGERLLERFGCHLFEPEVEDVAMRAEAVEGPREIGLGRDADGAAGGDDAEQHTGALRAFGAAGDEQVEAELATFWNSRSVGELSIGTSGSSTKRKSASPWFLYASHSLVTHRVRGASEASCALRSRDTGTSCGARRAAAGAL